MTKGLPERKKDITSSEKVVWLDSYEDLKDGNYDVIFKSAKYNHVRNEIDTETMQERGRRKRPQDGDEEKTHLCIRLAKGENRFLAVHESNHYGITLKCIIDYLNEQFKKFNEDGNDPYHYTIESQIMPGEDFLSSIKRAKTMSVLKLTVYKDDIKDGFMRFAGRTDIADEVDICLKRPKGYKCFPENLIKEYFKDSQDKAKGKIKRIKIIGTNDAGSFEVDTNITGMKHFFFKAKGLFHKILRLQNICVDKGVGYVFLASKCDIETVKKELNQICITPMTIKESSLSFRLNNTHHLPSIF